MVLTLYMTCRDEMAALPALVPDEAAFAILGLVQSPCDGLTRPSCIGTSAGAYWSLAPH